MIKKYGQNRKKIHFRAQPLFSVFAPKMPKISIFMKKNFLTIFLWVISDRKCFLYFWQTHIFNPLEPFCWGGYGTQNFSLKGWYRTLLSKMALACSNVVVCQKYRKLFLTEITHRKIVRKRFFHENWYFWHFWDKNWKNGPCAKVPFFRFCPFFLIKSKSIENTKKLVSPND